MNRNSVKYKIAVAGTGYVGMSLAVLLAQRNEVVAVDVKQERVDSINLGISPIKDDEISSFLLSGLLNLRATMDAKSAYRDADYVLVAVPTNYDAEKDYFDTHHIEDVVRLVLSVNRRAVIVIKSTIPIGYTESLRERMARENGGERPYIIFSPEFLREGRALYDNLYPSRIIYGIPKGASLHLYERAVQYAKLVQEGARKDGVPVLGMGSTEAEAVKLFANGYLAMRVAFFNELDSYAEAQGLKSEDIIRGVCLEPRIGDGYNNPSFGYGGYCFPKDTRQLASNFRKGRVPEAIMDAIVDSNSMRKRFVANSILQRYRDEGGGVLGVYRLAMKSGSDNSRESAVWDIMERLRRKVDGIIIYEPSCDYGEVYGDFNGGEPYRVVKDLAEFKESTSLIIANRMEPELLDVAEKVYTRDIFNNN